jgi:hypothetical protein
VTGVFCTSGSEREFTLEGSWYADEEIQAGADCDTWRKEFGGLKLDQAKRLKELERENANLKRLVAELSLEKQILKDVAEGNF